MGTGTWAQEQFTSRVTINIENIEGAQLPYAEIKVGTPHGIWITKNEVTKIRSHTRIPRVQSTKQRKDWCGTQFSVQAKAEKLIEDNEPDKYNKVLKRLVRKRVRVQASSSSMEVDTKQPAPSAPWNRKRRIPQKNGKARGKSSWNKRPNWGKTDGRTE